MWKKWKSKHSCSRVRIRSTQEQQLPPHMDTFVGSMETAKRNSSPREQSSKAIRQAFIKHTEGTVTGHDRWRRAHTRRKSYTRS